jgi:hypothetical protein
MLHLLHFDDISLSVENTSNNHNNADSVLQAIALGSL